MKSYFVIIVVLAVFIQTGSSTSEKENKLPDFIGRINSLVEIMSDDDNSTLQERASDAASLLIALAKDSWDYVCAEGNGTQSILGDLCKTPSVKTVLSIGYRVAKVLHNFNVPRTIVKYLSNHYSKPSEIPVLKGYNGPIFEGYVITDPSIPDEAYREIRKLLAGYEGGMKRSNSRSILKLKDELPQVATKSVESSGKLKYLPTSLRGFKKV